MIKIDPSDCGDLIYALMDKADHFERWAERDHSSQIADHKVEAIEEARKINISRLKTAERFRRIANELTTQLLEYHNG